MVAYGDNTGAARMLEPDTPDGFDAALTTRIAAMREVVSRLIDDCTGRTFGAVGTARQIIVPIHTLGSVLVLPVPARAITQILYGFDDEAGVISGGTALTTDAWTVALRDGSGNITALRAHNWWPGYGSVAITGTWADDGNSMTVPDEINWATNYLTAKSIAEENASPAGAIGPDGSVVPIRNPWNEPKVKAVLAKYRLVTVGLVL